MRISFLLIPGFLLFSSSNLFASAGTPSTPVVPVQKPSETENKTSEIATYLLNLGAYLGYDVQKHPTATTQEGKQGSSPGASPSPAAGTPGGSTTPQSISQNLLNFDMVFNSHLYLVNSSIGAILVNTAAQGATQFVPTNMTAYAAMNVFANYTFLKPPYNNPSTEQVSVSPLIDQQPYQADPVSQSILNMLGTPDFSYCVNNEGTEPASCTYRQGLLNETQVMINSVGIIPSTQEFFTYDSIQPLLSQLNSNSLIAPLLYSTTSTGAGNTAPQASTSKGLTAQTQAQQAANFIRYAIGAVAPFALANRMEYDALYTKAANINGNYKALEQQQAQAALSTYLTGLRVYAAQASVGISNLYHILSKRLPQDQSVNATDGKQTSQALSEYAMASWRLYNPNGSQNTDWLSKINQASAATVQKEMVTLLAEINYQLYLSRQLEERLLLTNSILLLQNARTAQPSASLNSTGNALSTPSSSGFTQ